MDHARTAQLPLTLGALLGEDVAAVRMSALEATRSGFAKSLRRSAIGFHLRHIQKLQ
jgi:hypothetical protein